MEKNTVQPFVDPEKSVFFDQFDLKLNINDAVDSEESPKGLLVTIDATHGGFINRNYFFYQTKYMKDAVKTWTNPYNKPMLLHHKIGGMWQDAADPIGRIVGAEFVDTGKDTGFIRLKALITDPDAIEKVKDGRYVTVSTSQRPAGPVYCSVCGANLLDPASDCMHSRGRKYVIEKEGDGKGKKAKQEIKTCYYLYTDLEYRECSFVNEPADQSPKHAATVIKWEARDSIEGELGPANEDDTAEHNATVEIASDELLDSVSSETATDDDSEETPKENTSEETPTETPDGDSEETEDEEQTPSGEDPEPESTEDEDPEDSSSEEEASEEEESEDEPQGEDNHEDDINKLMDVLKSELWR